MGQIFHGIPRKTLLAGQNQCHARENIEFPADRDGTHPESFGKATRIHLSLSSSWDGWMARPPKLLQRIDAYIESPHWRYCWKSHSRPQHCLSYNIGREDGPHVLLVRTLMNDSPIPHSYLSPSEHSLIFQIYASLIYVRMLWFGCLSSLRHP